MVDLPPTWQILTTISIKNAALPHCCQVSNNEDAPTTTILLQITFPDWCRNEFGSSKTYLSMFTSFYYEWTLADAAQNAAQPHCCWVPMYEDIQTTTWDVLMLWANNNYSMLKYIMCYESHILSLHSLMWRDCIYQPHRLPHKYWKGCFWSGFIKMSASCSCVLIGFILINPFLTCSQKWWYLRAMCLIFLVASVLLTEFINREYDVCMYIQYEPLYILCWYCMYGM